MTRRFAGNDLCGAVLVRLRLSFDFGFSFGFSFGEALAAVKLDRSGFGVVVQKAGRHTTTTSHAHRLSGRHSLEVSVDVHCGVRLARVLKGRGAAVAGVRVRRSERSGHHNARTHFHHTTHR